MTNDVPDRVWPDRVWLEDEFGEGHDDQFQYGCWDCRNVYGYQEPYLRASPARLHAEELVEALRDATDLVAALTSETIYVRKRAGGQYVDVRETVHRLRALLSRIEQETTDGKEQAND